MYFRNVKKLFVNCHTHFLESNHLSLFQVEQAAVNQAFSYGIHPWDAATKIWNPTLIQNKNCLAVGECGLDKMRGPELQTQEKLFRFQIEQAEKSRKPLILHCVKAWEEVRKIKRVLQPQQTWIFHGLAKVNLIDEVISEGLMPSFGKAILYHATLLEKVAQLDGKQYFLETDDTHLHIEILYRVLAKAKNVPLHDLIAIQNENFNRIFGHGKMVGANSALVE